MLIAIARACIFARVVILSLGGTRTPGLEILLDSIHRGICMAIDGSDPILLLSITFTTVPVNQDLGKSKTSFINLIHRFCAETDPFRT